ncbi:MAG: phosphoribosyltransferase family protein [Phycisphaerae bacterium]
MPRESIWEDSCPQCRREAFWNIAGSVRAGLYRQPLKPLILALKYGGKERNADVFGALLADSIRSAAWSRDIELLVPVPMNRWRRFARPCDHARLIADATAQRLRIPVRAAVRRVRNTPSQARATSRQARFDNVRGCFAPSRRPGVEGKTVCIIDNLLVSGATICEVSKALRRAGAKHIYAAVVARSVTPGEIDAEIANSEWRMAKSQS